MKNSANKQYFLSQNILCIKIFNASVLYFNEICTFSSLHFFVYNSFRFVFL